MTCSELYASMIEGFMTVTMLDRLYGDMWHEPMRHLVSLNIIKIGYQGQSVRFYTPGHSAHNAISKDRK